MTQVPSGTVHLVGAGPGDPELLTVKAHRLLAQTDVVLHDDLVPAAILAVAGPQAEVVNVGKRCGAKGITQGEIEALMIAHARRSLDVVRLKSGDPGIFGRLAEEIDALTSAGVPFDVVPGITAGLGAAASLGVSLTDRRKSARVVVVTGHHAHRGGHQEKPDWKHLAQGNATLVIYMPGHDFASLRQEFLAAGLAADIPAAIVSHATTPQQRHEYTTIGDLDKLPVMDSPTILLVGRVLEDAGLRAAENPLLALDDASLIFSSR
ncbi:MAG TPA: uroporphyrinogen-III C-methyltransferase [Candidatus Acidoferrales bacterium]|jgi:uroporphyrin-III C-methyltransferase|nr:uroporphyrinogen-III C-methyltransferase [Candidatus Acidoferrales bacterium]